MYHHVFRPGDRARFLTWFQDLSFDGDDEEHPYVCTFEAGEVVTVTTSSTIAITDDLTEGNIPFTPIMAKDANGIDRVIVVTADNLAPVASA